MVRPPIRLNRRAKKLWKIVTDELDKVGSLSVLDFPSIAAYCIEMDLYYTEMEFVEAEGSVIILNNGKQKMKVQNPHYKNAIKALTNAKAMADRFGLNSMSRKKLNMKEESQDNDPAADL